MCVRFNIYIHAHVCTHTCMWVCLFVYVMYEGACLCDQRSPRCVFSIMHHLDFRDRVSLNLELADEVSFRDLPAYTTAPSSPVCAENLNSGLHSCRVSTLFTKMSLFLSVYFNIPSGIRATCGTLLWSPTLVRLWPVGCIHTKMTFDCSPTQNHKLTSLGFCFFFKCDCRVLFVDDSVMLQCQQVIVPAGSVRPVSQHAYLVCFLESTNIILWFKVYWDNM